MFSDGVCHLVRGFSLPSLILLIVSHGEPIVEIANRNVWQALTVTCDCPRGKRGKTRYNVGCGLDFRIFRIRSPAL